MFLNKNLENDDFLKYLVSGDALFHYTRKNITLENILLNKQLKFGSFSGTNDPQEYRPKLTGAIGWGWDSKSSEVTDAMMEIENICQKRSRFISFCVNQYENDVIEEYGFLKSRMWAQYGDNHEGACVVLSKEKILGKLGEFKNENQEVLSSKVTYRNPERRKLPILKVDRSDFDKKDYNDVALQFVIENKSNYLFSKQTDYRDECEFRVVIVNKQPVSIGESDSFVNVDDALVGVVFGDRFPKVYSPSVRELVKDSNLIAKQLVWDKAGYHVLDLTRY